MLRLFIKAQAAWVTLRTRLENEDGVIATEYIIMLVLVALAIILGATFLGVQINNKLSDAGSSVTNIAP